MTTLTIQPSDADVYITEENPDFNTISDDFTIVDNQGSGKIIRSSFKFDFSVLPDSVVVTSAIFSIYYFQSGGGTPAGRTYKTKRITQTDWIEDEVTWNDYADSSAWSSGGGDFTETFVSSSIVPAVGNWMNYDVLGQVLYAKKNVLKVAHFIIMDANEGGSQNQARFYSNREATQTTLRPKLVLEYYLISSLSTTKPSRLYSGIKEAYFKDGWENEKYIYIEQLDSYPCIVQFIDTYADTENEE